MIDLTPVRNKEMTLSEACAYLDKDTLRAETNEVIDTILDIIADCVDEDVVFVPIDPDADDTYAASEDDKEIAWTLGHVIVHVTAGSEEGAFTAAELARGVEFHGRSRYETPWETMKTMDQVRHRLEESRRIRLATLEVWPDEPHMENTVHLGFMNADANAIERYAVGYNHEIGHLEQIREIVRQAKAARS